MFLDVSQSEVTWEKSGAKQKMKVLRKNEWSNEILVI